MRRLLKISLPLTAVISKLRLEAKRLANEIGDAVQKSDRDGLIFIQGNLAHALLFQGHYDEALAIFRQGFQPMNYRGSPLSQHAFFDVGEEVLRFHFLVQLNGVFEGQATGEIFNFQYAGDDH